MSQEKVEKYSEESIKTLEPKEHIRLRPGMYIGKLGDGSSHDDGIYVLIKEVIDNSIDEFGMGHGKVIDIEINDKECLVRDRGRGIPLGKLVDVVDLSDIFVIIVAVTHNTSTCKERDNAK